MQQRSTKCGTPEEMQKLDRDFQVEGSIWIYQRLTARDANSTFQLSSSRYISDSHDLLQHQLKWLLY